jgi:hypothetical protein
MWFLLPQNIQALFSDTGEERDHVPMYINPQSVDIKESKLIQHTLTKGGYMVQYWGEELPTMTVSGTTGSGGIEAINILRDIYRHEQLIMRKILKERAEKFGANTIQTFEDSSSATAAAGLLEAVDQLFQGGVSDIIDGTQSFLDSVVDAFNGVSSSAESDKFAIVPTLASFAVSIDIFFQGVKYRGFFKSFSSREVAESPGIFNYDFVFMITRKTGRRNNFMPWHRSPTWSGRPRPASTPIQGAASHELSYPTNADYGTGQEQIISTRMSSAINSTQE